MTLLIIYATVSIFFSFLCSVLEAVLLSVTPTFIAVKKNEGKSYATALEKLKEDIDEPLITILTINTVAHTVGAILVGVQAEKTFGSGNNAVGIVSAIMTILILVVSEIIPKTIGATLWKQLAGFSAVAIKILMFPLKYTGILWLLKQTTRLIGKSEHIVMSKEELAAMTDIAQDQGVFDTKESAIIKNLINFEQVKAKQIMTPRTVLQSASENVKISDFYEKYGHLNHSRVPVYNKSTDDITGYFLKDEMLNAMIQGKGEEPLASIKRDILVYDRNTPIPELFEKLTTNNEHISLIVDEYGSVSGIVTQEDIIETLLGFEIIDEIDDIEDMQSFAKNLWDVRAKNLGLKNTAIQQSSRKNKN